MLPIGPAVLVDGLAPSRLRDSIVAPPKALVLFEFAVRASSSDLLEAPAPHDAIHTLADINLVEITLAEVTLAEITLALVLFSDGARIDQRVLLRNRNLPRRRLPVGMLLTIALRTIAPAQTPTRTPIRLGWIEAAPLETVQAPNDAVLSQDFVSHLDAPVLVYAKQ